MPTSLGGENAYEESGRHESASTAKRTGDERIASCEHLPRCTSQTCSGTVPSQTEDESAHGGGTEKEMDLD